MSKASEIINRMKIKESDSSKKYGEIMQLVGKALAILDKIPDPGKENPKVEDDHASLSYFLDDKLIPALNRLIKATK